MSSSLALALTYVPASALPAAPDERALVSPAGTLDPSVAAALEAQAGVAAAWDFVFGSGASQATVTLADLSLAPADALALTRADLERLAAEAAGRTAAELTGGSGGRRYERAAELSGLIGRRPATPAHLQRGPGGGPARRAGRPRVGFPLRRRPRRRERARRRSWAPRWRCWPATGSAPRTARRCGASWALVPPGASRPTCLARSATPAWPPLPTRRCRSSRLAWPRRPTRPPPRSSHRPRSWTPPPRWSAPPASSASAAPSPRADLPALQPAPDLDGEYLTVVAAVRPALARLEASQLAAETPFAAWANRPADPWQTDDHDGRPLVAVYADPALGLAPPPALIAAVALDQFDEVVPSADQRTGAAFGFDAPAARAQQAILLAVPPSTATPLDQPTLAQILVETRELAHARMARPVDLDEEVWGLAPTCLLPASGTIATPLELLG